MKTTKILPLLLIITLPLIVMAQPPKGSGPCQDGPDLDHPMMVEKLNLTEDQVASMEKLKIEHKKAMVQAEADLKLARIELDELIKNDTPEKKIDAAIDKVSSLKAKIFKARIHQRLDMAKILTDEQKELLKKHRNKMMKKHRHGRKEMRKSHDRCKNDCHGSEMAPEHAPTE